jgi:hypothetical protein
MQGRVTVAVGHCHITRNDAGGGGHSVRPFTMVSEVTRSRSR